MWQVISTLGEGKMYYTAKLHPNTDKQNMLFAGCADKKVYQWDANSGDLVQVNRTRTLTSSPTPTLISTLTLTLLLLDCASSRRSAVESV